MILISVVTLIVGTSKHYQHNMNLQKSDSAAMCLPRSPMIKSAKDREEDAESSPNSIFFFTTWEVLPIYRAWFTNLLLILGIKSLIPYQGLLFREIRDLETGKFADKHLFCIFSTSTYLSIKNFPYAVGWPVGGLKILDESPWS